MNKLLPALAAAAGLLLLAAPASAYTYQGMNYCAKVERDGSGKRITNNCNEALEFNWCDQGGSCDGMSTFNARIVIRPGQSALSNAMNYVVVVCHVNDDVEDGLCVSR